MPNATVLGLVRVTVLELETVSTCTLPNESEVGLILIFPASPVPLKSIDATEPAESVIDRLADRSPSPLGLKVTVTSHLLLAERVVPQMLTELAGVTVELTATIAELTKKSPGLAPVI
jgi:hypothetical protein